jgi:predicted metal-dependent hydrolase
MSTKTEKHQITVHGLVVDVVRKDIKNLHLGVYPPAGRIRVAVPLRVNDEAVRLFTISKLGWSIARGRQRSGYATTRCWIYLYGLGATGTSVSAY